MFLLPLSREDEIAESMLKATWFSGIATSIGVLLALVALGFTLWQIKSAAASVREAAKSEKASSIAKARPYVSVRIVTGIGGGSSLDMIVENHGQSTARGVKVAPESGKYDQNGLTPDLARALQTMFEQGFDLAPGERRRFFWRLDPVDTSLAREQQPPSVRDELMVTYGWDRVVERSLSFVERVRIDVTDYVVLIPSPGTGATTTGGTDHMHRDLRDLRLAMNALSEHIAELRR